MISSKKCLLLSLLLCICTGAGYLRALQVAGTWIPFDEALPAPAQMQEVAPTQAQRQRQAYLAALMIITVGLLGELITSCAAQISKKTSATYVLSGHLVSGILIFWGGLAIASLLRQQMQMFTQQIAHQEQNTAQLAMQQQQLLVLVQELGQQVA